MTTPNTPYLEGQPPPTTGLRAAEPAAPRTTVGEPKGAARKSVPSALRSDPRQGDGRYPVAWLHIAAPNGATPTARSRCLCGWDRSAVGHRRALALIDAHAEHRATCPLRNPQEGRNAA